MLLKLHSGVFLIGLALFGQTSSSPVDTGRKALDLLLSKKFPELSALFSESFQQTITLDFLEKRVAAELAEFGQMQSVGDAIVGSDGPNSLVSFPVRFANTALNIQFTLNRSGQIAGMYFRPPDKPLPATWNRPAYSKPELFRSREVTIGSDMWKLSGTLTTPAGNTRVPGVVLVHGPGPNDRDESLFATRIFADLAEGLASRGYAVLRYEKRTKTYGKELSETGYTLQEETVEDALRAVALLRTQPEVDRRRIYVLGHSLGGYASPRIAARDGKLAGLIVLGGPARPIEDVAYDQSDYLVHLNGEPRPNEQARLAQLAAEVQRVKSLAPGGNNPDVVLGLPAGWWLSVKGYDPVAEAAKLGIPMLVLQGERDFQVTMKDFALWQSGLDGRSNAVFHSYPKLNGLFIAGENKSTPAEYHNPGNVAPQVIDDIAAWLSAKAK
ncbi:MAG: hypothetical protein C5B51_08570 [Terriglobia bacterium]|nr:MAG: hypothetical protein C5B51_08570 [Terriglobia bacterium]